MSLRTSCVHMTIHDHVGVESLESLGARCDFDGHNEYTHGVGYECHFK